jgi:stress-induced-phosphoprotein 1
MVQVLTLMLNIKFQNQSNGAPEPATAQSNPAATKHSSQRRRLGNLSS